MAEEQEHRVHIVSWPEESAKHEHEFKMEKPCPVSISFEKRPAHVLIHTSPEQPLHVDMNMNVLVRRTIPVCIKLCEPLCAKSEYTIGISIFDNPVAAITIQGETRLYNCREKEEPEPICIDFHRLKGEMSFAEPLSKDGLTFSPLNDQLRTVTFGDPPGKVKLAFPPEGIRIDFPHPVDNVTLTVNNYAHPTLEFSIYSGTSLINRFSEQINNEAKEIIISEFGVIAIEIKGGDNEAALIEVCYSHE